MTEEEISRVAAVLNKWNPLGPKAEAIPDLGGYRTEAIDIISALTVFEKLRNPRDVVMDGLNQAFELDLTPEECEKPAQEILAAFGRGAHKGSPQQAAARDRAKRGA